jgi:hypothetical protein
VNGLHASTTQAILRIDSRSEVSFEETPRQVLALRPYLSVLGWSAVGFLCDPINGCQIGT